MSRHIYMNSPKTVMGKSGAPKHLGLRHPSPDSVEALALWPGAAGPTSPVRLNGASQSLPNLTEKPWQSLTLRSALERCCTVTKSQAAFLMDLDCKMLDGVGTRSCGELALVAPRLLAALGQMSLIDQPLGLCLAVSGNLGSYWLTGISIKVPGGSPLLLGLLGFSAVEGSLKPQLDRVFSCLSIGQEGPAWHRD